MGRVRFLFASAQNFIYVHTQTGTEIVEKVVQEIVLIRLLFFFFFRGHLVLMLLLLLEVSLLVSRGLLLPLSALLEERLLENRVENAEVEGVERLFLRVPLLISLVS